MQRIVLDTDMGIDDALALLYLLGSADARIEAITTVHGNVPVDVATANVFEVLAIAGIEDPPLVARGAAGPISAAGVDATHVHGADGLGGWTKKGRVGAGTVSGEPAHEIICRVARQWPGEVGLLLIGPATNAALALERDPQAFQALKRVVMMAGAVWEPGNVTAAAEFNVYADPQAARAVVHSGIPLTMVGLDVTRKVSITRALLEDWLQARQDPRAAFLRCIAEQGFLFFKKTSGWEGLYLHDPLAAAVALDASFIETQRMRLDVETAGDLTRGMTVAERRPWVKGSENVDYSIAVDAGQFLNSFRERAILPV